MMFNKINKNDKQLDMSAFEVATVFKRFGDIYVCRDNPRCFYIEY